MKKTNHLSILNKKTDRSGSVTVLLILVGISLIAGIPLPQRGIHVGHDLPFHLARIEGLAGALRSGQFPARMNTFFYNGYGYPVGIFYGELLLYFPAVLRLAGVSVTAAYKAYVVMINFLTAVLTYTCGSQIFKNKNTALILSFVYTLAPYRLMDIYVRSAVGEYTALAFLPVIALALWNIYTEHTSKVFSYREELKNAILLAFGMLVLLYTHVLSTEMAAVLIAVVVLTLFRRSFTLKRLKTFFISGILFFLGGTAFIVPFLDYYLHTDVIIKKFAGDSKLIQADGAYFSGYFDFFKNIFGHSVPAAADRMILTPGLILMTGLFIAFVLWILQRANKRIKYLSLMSVFVLFLASNRFPWNVYTYTYPGLVMAQVQFPWRYIGFSLVFLALLLGCELELLREKNTDGKTSLSAYRKIAFLIVISGLIMTGVFMKSYYTGTGNNPYEDSALLSDSPGNGQEYLLMHTALSPLEDTVYSVNAEAEIESETGINMELTVRTPGNAMLDIPRFFYPYYRIADEYGNEYGYECGFNNTILIRLFDSYDGKISISWHEPWFWRVSELISLFTVLLMIYLMFRLVIKTARQKDIPAAEIQGSIHNAG